MEKSTQQLKLYSPETKFFIKMVNFESGAVKTLPDITLSDYKKNLKYLKYLNAQGFNVFLSTQHLRGAWILLDDIKKPIIDKLYADRLEPFYYLETSPDNFQAIIKLSDTTIDRDILSFISKQLAEVYGADPNSADPGHFFRLAGYTNRKLKYCNENGLFPFVKLYAGVAGACSKGRDYIDRINEGINNGLIELPVKHIPTTLKGQRERKLTSGCTEYVRKVYAYCGMDDMSRLDFKAALYALKKGFSQDDIINAIKLHSPDLESRKKGHIDDYVLRTVKNASYKAF